MKTTVLVNAHLLNHNAKEIYQTSTLKHVLVNAMLQFTLAMIQQILTSIRILANVNAITAKKIVQKQVHQTFKKKIALVDVT
jgi:hypothetical protein